MPMRQIRHSKRKQWRVLLVYNFYRLLSLFLFLGIYFYNVTSLIDSLLFFNILFIYLMVTVIFFSIWQRRRLSFEKQVMFSGTIDVIAVSTLLTLIGNLQSGYGIFLNITIAGLSILVPGRLAIFFAALASCSLFLGDVIQFIFNDKDLSTLYYSGIYGAGFFGTALTAWYLSNLVRVSENLAQYRSQELVGMQRINEYIVERLHSGIIYVDEKKQIKLINSAARQFFNLSYNVDPLHLEQLSYVLSTKCDNFLEKMKQTEGLAQSIIEEPYLRVHFFATTVANKAAVLIILEDMTYIAQQAQQLKLASLGRFSASIAHELRNPLGAISHAVQLLGDDESFQKEDMRLKQLIINNCERMNGVIKNVLQLSRREKSHPQVNEVSKFIEQFIQNFGHNHQCNLTIKLPRKKTSIVFDKSQLEQVLVILCDNAIQHGRDESGDVNITITVKSLAHKIIIIVSDLGPGIPLKYKDNIFEPFFTTLRSGTGMGLFIARELCEINQARLNIHKTKKGSAFAITLNSSDELLI
ncbi:MAG: ATP-binding protein [bacterium]|nr:ATP-binding protein [bacterium]